MSQKKPQKILLLACALAAPALSHAAGFVEDSQLNLLSRNVYWHHDGHKGAVDRREWAQGFQLAYTSGYTPGVIGLGLDAHAYTALKLDSTKNRARTGLLVPDADGGSRDEASAAGGAVKLRWSNTELKWGDLRPYNPVIALSDARLMPATARGWHLTSKDIPGIGLEAGHFTSGKGFNRTHHNGRFRAAYAGVDGGDIDFVGISHQARPDLALKLYVSRYQDLWHQYYANGNYDIALQQGRGVNLDLNVYRSLDTGAARAGDIQVTAWSLAAAYRFGPHKLGLAHQKIHGEQRFDYLGLQGGGLQDSIFLANSSQYADFNAAGERSWRLRYDLDLSTLGVPGLTLMARYIRSNQDHWERDVEARYVVQSGKAKDLSLHLRYATHRIASAADVNVDQVRLIVQWPVRLL